MATTTSGNLNLVKPSYSDKADIAVINSNMDTIDSAVSAIQNWKPATPGSNNQILKSNGNGTTRWDNEASTAEITTAVTTWLNDHVPTGQTLIVDTSLTVSGAAAESASTGSFIEAIRNAIATDFYGDKNYAVGQFVWNGDTLYVFTSDHPAGVWNSSHVRTVILADDVYALRTAIENIDNRVSALEDLGLSVVDGVINVTWTEE